MTKPRKISVRDYRCDVSPYELEGTLVDLRNRLNDWIDSYGPTAKLDWDAHFQYEYDPSPSPRFNIVNDREETDEEFDKRLVKEAHDRQLRETAERVEFERLKKKFE